MNYFFHPEAKKELLEAIKYYNECGSGLGYIFMEEAEATIDRVIKGTEGNSQEIWQINNQSFNVAISSIESPVILAATSTDKPSLSDFLASSRFSSSRPFFSPFISPTL
jgi:hypothetical protein